MIDQYQEGDKIIFRHNKVGGLKVSGVFIWYIKHGTRYDGHQSAIVRLDGNKLISTVPVRQLSRNKQ